MSLEKTAENPKKELKAPEYAKTKNKKPVFNWAERLAFKQIFKRMRRKAIKAKALKSEKKVLKARKLLIASMKEILLIPGYTIEDHEEKQVTRETIDMYSTDDVIEMFDVSLKSFGEMLKIKCDD